MSTLSLVAGLTAGLVAALAADRAEAHRFEHPKSLRIGVDAHRLVISALYDLNPGQESQQIRALFDRDTSGELDEAEQAKLREWLATTAMTFFELELGPPGALQPVSLTRVEAQAHRLAEPVDTSSNLGISLLFEIELPPGPEVEIRIKDRDKDASKHVPLVGDIAVGFVVAYASQGEWVPKLRQLHRVALAARAPLTLVVRRSPQP